jgi:hypothetical protein
VKTQQIFKNEAIYLIQPDLSPMNDAPPFNEYYDYPKVTCAALLMRSEPVRSILMNCSSLVVVWLQDEFAFPTNDSISKAFRNLDWNNLAFDCNK